MRVQKKTKHLPIESLKGTIIIYSAHLINLNEIFRKCGHDTNLNLQSTAVFTNMNQLPQMAHFKCQET